MPARIIDGGGSVVATVGSGAEERVTLADKGRQVFLQDGSNAIIAGTERGFDLFQLDDTAKRIAWVPVGPGDRFKKVALANERTAEGVTLV